ncbi:MAG TPA: acyltransferase [Actinomycetota bacterium]
MGRDPSVYVHEAALCESEDVGPRTRIWAFAHVMRGARVGQDCNIGGHAFVEDGAVVGDRVTVKNGVMIWDRVEIEDDAFLGPGCAFTNDDRPRTGRRLGREELIPTRVRRGASIGANATIVCGVTIGSFALVGAGAVVTRDVPAHALVVGNPATRTGWVCECGRTLDEGLACGCGRRYRRVTSGLEPAASGDEDPVVVVRARTRERRPSTPDGA